MFAVSVAAIPQAKQPAGQGRHREPVPCRVQDDHAGGVNEAVDGGGLQPGGDSALAVRPYDRVGVPVGDIRGDARYGEYGLGTHTQGDVLQESICADAGRQSRAELVVLAR
jgi:hypothetical protein